MSDFMEYVIYTCRFLNVVLGAAYFAVLLLVTIRMWDTMERAEKVLFIALLWFAGGETTLTALVISDRAPITPLSYLQIVITPTLLGLYYSLSRVRRFR